MVSKICEKEDLLENIFSFFTAKELILNYCLINKISNRVAHTFLTNQYFDVRGVGSPIYDREQIIEIFRQRIRTIEPQEVLHIQVFPFIKKPSQLSKESSCFKVVLSYNIAESHLPPTETSLDLLLDEVALPSDEDIKGHSNHSLTNRVTRTVTHFIKIDYATIDNLEIPFLNLSVQANIIWNKKIAEIQSSL